MALPRPRFRLSISGLLGLVVVAAACLSLRQALYVPVAGRAALRQRIEEAGVKVVTEAPPPSWRDWLFSPDVLRDVTAIEVVDGTLPPDVLPRLWRLPGLRSVKLRGCDVTDADTAHLAKVRGLATLDLANSRVGDAGLTTLAALPLEDLDLMGTRITGDSIPAIADMPALTRLILPARIEPASLAPLARLSRLTILAQEVDPNRDTARLQLETLPGPLRDLPLAYVGGAFNPFTPGSPESRHGPPTAEGPTFSFPFPADQIAVPAGGWRAQTLRAATVTAATPPAVWDWLAGYARIGTLRVPDAAPEALSFDVLPHLDRLPPIEELQLVVRTLDAETLRKLLRRPGLSSLFVTVGDLAMTADEFVEALTSAPPLAWVSLHGPWTHRVMPGLDRLATDAPFDRLNMAGFSPAELRRGGRSVWTGTATTGELTVVPLGVSPPPAWLLDGLTKRDGWLRVHRSGYDAAPLSEPEVQSLLVWLRHPRTAIAALALSPPVDTRILDILATEDHLATVALWAPLSDEQALRLMARPTLRSLMIASPRLTDALPGRVQEFPHLHAVLLQSPHYGRADFERHRPPPGTGEIAWLTPDAKPAGPKSLAVTPLNADLRSWPAATPADDPVEPVLYLGAIHTGKSPEVREELARAFPDATAATLILRPADAWWDVFAAFPRLRHLSISLHPVDPAGDTSSITEWMTSLAGAPPLESLLVGWPEGGPTTDMAWLTGQPDLRTLSVGGPVEAGGLSRLAGCPRLEAVGLGPIVGDDAAARHDTTFLRNGRRWRALIAPDLRVGVGDLAALAATDTVEAVVADGLLVDASAVPALERLCGIGARIRLVRPDLDPSTIQRLRDLAAARGGSFDVVTNRGELNFAFDRGRLGSPPLP